MVWWCPVQPSPQHGLIIILISIPTRFTYYGVQLIKSKAEFPTNSPPLTACWFCNPTYFSMIICTQDCCYMYRCVCNIIDKDMINMCNKMITLLICVSKKMNIKVSNKYAAIQTFHFSLNHQQIYHR